ncbi:MAG: YgfZ/GcvT domain-containing protein [Candidatus Binatales bacterium]
MKTGAEAGAFEREYRALTLGVGFRVLDDRIIVRVTGDDRAAFLHGMSTNDVKGLPVGGILYALFLTEHAHVIADCFIWAAEDALLIEADRASWPQTRAQLEKLLVADDVEMEESDETVVIDLEGPASIDAVRRLIPDPPEPWRYVRDGSLMIGNVPRIGIPAFTILAPKHLSRSVAGEDAPREQRGAVATGAGEGAEAEAIAARLGGPIEVGAEAIDTIRIENGIARVGVDTGEKTIALEARLNGAISFSKGCYLGQETIERATARGGLKKRLFGLRFDGSRVAEIGAAVLLDGKEVGHVSSAALSPRMGAIGLAILHHSAWTPGTKLEVSEQSGRVAAGNFGAVVSDLPFK